MRLRSAADLGAFAAERREQLGWTQQQLANKAHVTRDWVARFETGARNVTVNRVMHVYRALGLTLVALVEDTGGRDE